MICSKFQARSQKYTIRVLAADARASPIKRTTSDTNVRARSHTTRASDHDSSDLEKASAHDEKAVHHDRHNLTAALPEFDDPNLNKDAAIAAGILEDDSPYPEVRPPSPTRTTEHPVATFFFRYPAVTVTSIVAQLLTSPSAAPGRASSPTSRYSASHSTLHQEHVLITIMAGIGASNVYATDIGNYSFGYQWMVVISTQLIGFSIGGIARRFLVQPPSMIWPYNLVTCAPVQHAACAAVRRCGFARWVLERKVLLYRFCWCAAPSGTSSPGYLFIALSYSSWVCWIVPDNIVVNQLFGVNYGLAMGMVTFDWAQITHIGSPARDAMWAEANIAVGFVFFFWILTPALYFTNTWYAKYMPISSGGSFDNRGKTYKVANILTDDKVFDEAKYKAYSPIFLSTTFAISYGCRLRVSPRRLRMLCDLFFRKQIWTQSPSCDARAAGYHARLMAVYPRSRNGGTSSSSCPCSSSVSVSIEVWDTKFPVQYFILALVIAFFYVIPIGMIQAITNQQVGFERHHGADHWVRAARAPRRDDDVQDVGVYHYGAGTHLHLGPQAGSLHEDPPRAPCSCARSSRTVIAGTTQLGVQAWMFTNIPDMCNRDIQETFWCPSTQVFGTASIIWGVIGPARQFSSGQIYYALTFFFLVGFLCPVFAWLATRKWPNSWLRYLNFPVIFSGTGLIPPANSNNYVPWAIVGFIFQYVIRRRHFAWWTKYNYVLSAALDSGVAVSAVLIFFCLQYPRDGAIGKNTIQAWWGNNVYLNTADGEKKPMWTLAVNQTFGPATW
ncbi:OPT oligopeptide transporter [Mycena rebaudengoi]|nr:OPT oligopeptide transporter [Mycena rebaudengoi]